MHAPSVMCERAGQSLVEIIIAVAIGVIIVIGAITVVAPSIRLQADSVRVQIAAALGKELMDNVRVFAESSWSSIASLSTSSAVHYYLNASSSPFTTSTGDQAVMVGTSTYTRYFYLSEVQRSVSGMIVASGGTADPSTRKVTVAYRWASGTIWTMETYLTRSRSETFRQTDWSLGGGQDGPITTPTSRFSTSTGSINVASSSGSILLNL
jgi:Tfp pilus assembly protein PilV